MQKIQSMLDAAFGQQADHVPQEPSEAVLERAKAFSTKAQKLHELRQARASRDASPPPIASLTFDVVRHRGFWRIRHRNKHSSPYPDQTAAIKAAQEAAREKMKLGHPVEVRLLRVDGQIVGQPVVCEGDG